MANNKLEGLDVYDDAELYDILWPPDAATEDFYMSEASHLSGSVLELACGTGRIAIPLVKSGLDVTGIDIHPAMLARARSTSLAAKVSVDFIEADMKQFALPQKFGLIFVGFNSLLHLLSAEDLVSCFGAVARHLAPGGKFILDIVNTSPRWLSLPPGERRKIGGALHPELGEITIEQTLEYDRSTQISHETWFFSAPGQPDFRVRSVQMRMIYPQELPLLLKLGGLVLVDRFGGYDRRTFDQTSPRQLCVCEKAV